ncbi:MAG: inositol 2-dehydrogenase [Gammaproteobacteria bacterium]|nr:inositol 2-dehydrogenase [Gammaproteobacteria bacterium]
MLKVGLLGAGRIGKVHARAITAHPGSELTAVSDVVTDNAEKLAEEYGSSVRSSTDIINDSAIDAVLIASSTDTHADLIEAATSAGKAVLCEKPVDLSLERAQACRDAANKTGQPVMIGFNRRFDPNFETLKNSLTRGEIGKAELLSITSFDPEPPPLSYVKVSGGLFRDMMAHDFDMTNFILGTTPETVSATGSAIVDPKIGEAGDVDTAVATMAYANGMIAVIKNSRRAVYGYDQRMELLGSEGLLQANNLLESSVVKSTNEGVTGAKPMYFFLERYMPAYQAEWSAFVSAISAGIEPPVTLNDGVAALAMAEAAVQSMELGRPVKFAEFF